MKSGSNKMDVGGFTNGSDDAQTPFKGGDHHKTSQTVAKKGQFIGGVGFFDLEPPYPLC